MKRVTQKRGLMRMLKGTPRMQSACSRPPAATPCSRASRLRLASFSGSMGSLQTMQVSVVSGPDPQVTCHEIPKSAVHPARGVQTPEVSQSALHLK